jgi:hypothetical protein
LIEDKGIVILDLYTSVPLDMLSNPYITKMDYINTGDYIYLGLFIDNKDVDEFFVELAIPHNYLTDWRISRAYLSRKVFKYSSTNSFRYFTFISTDDATFLVPRNMLTEKMTPIYKINLPLSDYIIFSDVNHYSVIKQKNGPKDELIAFDFTRNFPYYECKFTQAGNFTAVISSYLRMFSNIMSEVSIVNTNVEGNDVPESSLTWVYVLIGAAALVVIIVVVVICVKKKMRDGSQPEESGNFNRL